MSAAVFPWHRYAVIATLAEKAPSRQLGRTALMKFAYFIQELRGVPLGYDFTLYAYGPFDAAVLDDLAYAQALDAVKVRIVYYPNGYGYEIRPGRAAKEVKESARGFLADHQDEIDWVIREFGNLSAAELELASTMVYVDREALRSSQCLTLTELVRQVLAVKPRFTEDQAYAQARSLLEKGLLQSIQP
jgi:uncharacterized protein YwgA